MIDEKNNKKILHAYIDECGTDSLFFDKKDVSRFFICVASIVDEEHTQDIDDLIIQLKKNVNMQPDHELKNKKIKSKRRIKILQDISKIPVQFYIFIVDKQQIKVGSGLSYKDSFYKYINRIFYQKIVSEIQCDLLKIYADKIGFPDFQNSFSKYIESYKPQPALFNSDRVWEHSFEESTDRNLIQISDVVAGTLMKHVDPDQSDDFSMICYNIIADQIQHIEQFPYRLISSISSDISDHGIYEYQEEICNQYIKQYNDSSDEDTQIRVETLKKLMMYSYNDKTVFAKALVNDINDLGYKITDRKLKTGILGKLREYGIIIVGTTKGYRLATSSIHVAEYLKYDESIIFPMLKKILAAKTGISKAFLDKMQLLDKESILSQMVSIYEIKHPH